MPGPEPTDLARLREALLALSSTERQVFLLHAAKRLDYEAIAERLAIPVTKVEQSLAAALVSLSRHLLSEAGCPDKGGKG
jgi:DNA-directed RNA polymerase specialized sigma24 family protein